MIVTVLNYHSSVITIMAKNDNVLCINCTDKNRDRSGTGTKPVKTASFFIKTGFSFVKNSLQSRLRPGCTHHGDPGAGEVQTRVCVRSLRGCVDVYPPCWRCFYALFWSSFLPMAVFLAVNGKYGKAFPHPYAPSHTYGVHRRTGQDEDAYVVSPAQSTG